MVEDGWGGGLVKRVGGAMRVKRSGSKNSKLINIFGHGNLISRVLCGKMVPEGSYVPF